MAGHLARSRESIAWSVMAAILGLSLYWTWPGIHAFFTLDDVMNLRHLHGALERPLAGSVLDVLQPWKPTYRPLGGLFYRVVFAIAGFHPLPFRVACFALLIGNLVLAFAVLRRVSGSREVALLGTLLLSYNAQMAELYFNTGTVYDLLCTAFFLAALGMYVAGRRHSGGFSWQALAGLAVLILLALESKEMACTLPAIWLLYELIYFGWPGRSSLRRFAACLIGMALAGAFLLVRMFEPSALSDNPLYHPTLSLAYYLRTAASYQGTWFGEPNLFGVPGLLGFWIGLVILALWLRSRAAIFGFLFWILTLVPVALLPARSGYVLYLPAFGLVLYLAAVLTALRGRFVITVKVPRLASQLALFAVIVSALEFEHAFEGPMVDAPYEQFQSSTRQLMSQLKKQHPTVPPRARILFVSDPFGPYHVGANQWFLMFALQLLYGDPGIRGDALRFHPHASGYDFVFAYSGGQLVDQGARPGPCPASAVVRGMVDDTSEGLCWTGDWLTEQFPEALSGTITHTDRQGATVALVFEGSRLAYFYTKAPSRGMGAIWIDGTPRGEIDLYAPDVRWRSSTVFSGLSSGQHTALLRVLGRHGSKATDSTVDVDAFESAP